MHTLSSRRFAIVFVFISALIAFAASRTAHAVGVTTYGEGLEPCKTYLSARDANAIEQVAFVDWLSGYFSGVNRTSTHRNNFLGLTDLTAALNSLDNYCRARPMLPFAAAAGALVLGAKPGPAAHALGEATSYGSADKTCQVYREARGQQEVTYWAEFTNWLGGYLSGVNAMSLRTTNILGDAELRDAVHWLDDYCSAHPPTSFGAAVEALVAANSTAPASSGLAHADGAP